MADRILRLFAFSFLISLRFSSSAFAAAHYLPEYEDVWGGYSSSEIQSHSQIQNAVQSCISAGYSITFCPSGYAAKISERCPYSVDKNYYKKCYSYAQLCMEKGYTTYCGAGYEPDNAQYCRYDSAYRKCKCAVCAGYDYSEAQAKEAGYEADGTPCNSCGILKYKRREADCSGFKYDSSNCGVSSCGKLGGETCLSGRLLKYKTCDSCAVPGCDNGKVDMDTYWCSGALKCWWPQK